MDQHTEGKEMNRQLRNVVLEEDALNPLDSQENKQVRLEDINQAPPTTHTNHCNGNVWNERGQAEERKITHKMDG